MSLFGKGPWMHLHINPDVLPKFQELMANQRGLFSMSAFAARTRLIGNSDIPSAMGINPPCWPCGDAPLPREQVTLDRNIHPYVARNLADESNETPWALAEEVEDATGISLEGDRYWGDHARLFHLLDEQTPVYGFWLVLLKRANLDDMNALREHSAAMSASQPFKTLSPAAKKDLGNALVSDGLMDYIDRKQVPVIIDFRTGDIWLGHAGKAFAEGLQYFLMAVTGTKAEGMECLPGKNAAWVRLALTAFKDRDINQLEREEAFLAAVAEDEEDGELEAESESMTYLTDTVREAEEEEKPQFTITDVATFAADSGVVASVLPGTSILLPGAKMTSVGTANPMDAIALLRLEPKAMICASRVSFLWTVGECRASASVDMTAELTECTYKGLEIDFSAGAHDALETGIPGGLLGMDGLSQEGAADRVNRYWFRYLLALRETERVIYTTACDALGLDVPVLPTVSRPVGLPAATPAEEGVVAAAVDRAASTLKDNLLPGETLTLTAPSGRTTTLASSAVETEIG